MNNVLEAIEKRFSCRAFKDVLSNSEKIQAIARAATQSPSALNKQGWQIIAVTNKTVIAELEEEGMRAVSQMQDKALLNRINSRGGKIFYNAPCVFIIAAQKSAYSDMDCGIVAQTIALAAKSLGLDSCIHGMTALAFSENKKLYFKELLKFPKNSEFAIAVLVGEAEKISAPHHPDDNKITYIP